MEGPNQASPNGANIPAEHREVRDGAIKQGRSLSQEEDSRIHEIAEGDLRNNRNEPLTEQDGPLKQQQQPPPGPIVRWERFLPVRTLRVLLVENDDSTRQVVSALLRNCSYEVTSAPNGVQAWKILEDLSNHIDLVLTEVVMPCVSGISLLDKIMNHKTYKNIPVVMMSSSDSMGTVFKCLSKGAVDFLVKPIRKNELKNLWQHVWRRCHSSSGSGSESGIQAQKSVKSRSTDDSDNDSGSNDDDENISSGLNARDGSDNGSGTQSSWTKCAVELESPQHDQFADPPDSTCAQVIHPKPEAFDDDLMFTNDNNEIQGEKEPPDDLMGKDFDIGLSEDQEKKFESYSVGKVSSKLINKNLVKLPEFDQNDVSDLGFESKDASDKPSVQAANLLDTIANGPEPIARETLASNRFIKISEGLDKTSNKNIDVSLELSSKRRRSIGDGGSTSHDDRNVLRRSDQSAFTRYTSVASNQTATGFGGSCVPFDNSLEAVKAESTYNKILGSDAAPLKQCSNSSNNINDMCSTAKNVFASPTTYKENTSISAGKCIHPLSAFHPMELQASQQNVQEKAEEKTMDMMIGKSKGVQPQVQVEHHHHHYHHHHLHIHSVQEQQHQQQSQPGQESFSLKNTVDAECGSSDKLVVPLEGNAANYSVIGSNSGSNHGSNGHNGSSTAVKVGELNMESGKGTAEHVGPEVGNGSGSAIGIEQQQTSRREAALKKFRQKRKERNFEKKVRYQSRKRLAEQRPRVRGQFARQNVQEQTEHEAER